jgi:uncharacterized membrane protein YfcA
MIGRIAGGQMPWMLALASVPGLALGARIGACFSYRVPAVRLRQILSIIVALAAFGLWRHLRS